LITLYLHLDLESFFALAGLAALILIVFWNAIFNGALTSEHYYPNNHWHAHEMLLGYAVAVIAGFFINSG